MDDGLATQLRQGTRAAHTLAEQTRFARAFLRGSISREAYLALLVDLRELYAALESACARSAGQGGLVASLHDPALARLDALEADLRWHAGDSGLAPGAPSPAALAYADHLGRLASRDPDLLVAHHYVRYLGDLSGGQVLGKVVRRAFALPPGAGDAFYRFEGIPDPAAWKAGYRSRLDALGVDAAGARRLVDEAIVAFRLSQGIFEAREGGLLALLRAHVLGPLSRAARRPRGRAAR